MTDPDYNKQTSRHKPAARWAARAAILAILVCLVAALLGISAGVDSGTRALAYLGMLILGPVFTWFLVFSLTKTLERSADARTQAAGMRERIDTVVFDIGNVLTDYAWRDWLNSAGYPPDLSERIAHAAFLSPVWNEFDRGVWSQEQFIDALVRNDPEIETEIRSVFSRSMKGLVTRRDRAIPWIRELKAAGYRVLYLSNFSARAFEDCAEALDFIPETDGGILSYREQLIKPDEEIYRLLIGRFGLTPARAVFIDDRAENVEAAEACGLRGILFETQEQAERALRAMQVEY